MYKQYLLLLFAAFVILLLWLILGMVVPYVAFNGNAGQWGDSFGGVNALFSGLGFIALTYTILLQVNSNTETKKHERLSFYLKLLDDLKYDALNVTSGKDKGLEVWESLIPLINPKVVKSVDKDILDDILRQLYNLTHQYLYIIKALEKDKIIDADDRAFIMDKLSLQFMAGISKICDKIYADDTTYKELFYGLIKPSVDELMKRLSKYLPEVVSRLHNFTEK